jgi:hypothetical protein
MPSIRKSDRQNISTDRDKVESQFNGSDTIIMWQELQTITDCKGKTIHVMDTVLLPDKLNNYFTGFEDNTVPPTQAAKRGL